MVVVDIKVIFFLIYTLQKRDCGSMKNAHEPLLSFFPNKVLRSKLLRASNFFGMFSLPYGTLNWVWPVDILSVRVEPPVTGWMSRLLIQPTSCMERYVVPKGDARGSVKTPMRKLF